MVRAAIEGFDTIFRVSDVPRAVDHYERLGFKCMPWDETYVFAERDDLSVHLQLVPEGDVAGAGALYVHVDDAEALAAEWREAGMEVTGPEDFEWGKHEGSHRDPDGNLIRFGSPVRR